MIGEKRVLLAKALAEVELAETAKDPIPALMNIIQAISDPGLLRP